MFISGFSYVLLKCIFHVFPLAFVFFLLSFSKFTNRFRRVVEGPFRVFCLRAKKYQVCRRPPKFHVRDVIDQG